MTRSVRVSTCLECTHDSNWHGARAGVTPGGCHHPGCPCLYFTASTAVAPRRPNPRHDRDLYCAYISMVELLEGDKPGAYNEAYELLMAGVSAWYARVTGQPPYPPAPGDRPSC